MARQLDRSKIKAALKKEEERFLASHPKSKVLFEKAKKSLLGGVPMNWMVKWPGHYPIFIDEGKGVHFTDVDGNKYLDLCLGDTGAMTGHAPDASVKAIVDRVQKGTTFMLPIEDALEVGAKIFFLRARGNFFRSTVPGPLRSSIPFLFDLISFIILFL